jgi:hypothetical protein
MKISGLQYDFWMPPARPGADAALIADLENYVGRRFPSEFTVALMLANGGVASYSSYRRGDYFVPLPGFLPVEDVRRAFDDAQEWGTPDGIVVVASGADDWLGFDYRAGAEPSVVYQEYPDAEIETVAASFEDLLGGLIEDASDPDPSTPPHLAP